MLSIGMLLGITQVGTMAAWTDSATVETGSFETGTLDLMVGEDEAGQLEGQGGAWQHTSLNLPAMAPGEGVARMLTVGNDGTIAFTYDGKVTSDGGALSGPNGLQVTVVKDGTAANTGTQASSNRTGTCTGGTATAVTDTPASAGASIHGSPVVLAPGATTTYCVVAELAASAPNSMQGASGTITLSFDAEQR